MGGTELKFIVFAANGYEAGKKYCVLVNGAELKADSGVYTITDVESDIVIEVSGMVSQNGTGSSSGEGFLSKLNKTEVLIALFVVCLVGMITYVVISNKKEEKKNAEQRAEKKRGKR
jgi:preprotein translocase subunit SecG